MTYDVAEDDFEPDYDLMRLFGLEPDDAELVETDDDDLELDDELVLRLLRGTTRIDPKSLLVRYLTLEEERESKKAWAALLRGGIAAQLPNNRREQLFNKVCWGLADLLNSDVAGSRKVAFTKPRGALEQHDRNRPVVREIYELYTSRQFSLEEAVARVAAKYKLSESTVRKLWYGKTGGAYREF